MRDSSSRPYIHLCVKHKAKGRLPLCSRFWDNACYVSKRHGALFSGLKFSNNKRSYLQTDLMFSTRFAPVAIRLSEGRTSCTNNGTHTCTRHNNIAMRNFIRALSRTRMYIIYYIIVMRTHAHTYTDRYTPTIQNKHVHTHI